MFNQNYLKFLKNYLNLLQIFYKTIKIFFKSFLKKLIKKITFTNLLKNISLKIYNMTGINFRNLNNFFLYYLSQCRY